MASKRDISQAAAERILRASDNENHGRGIGTSGRPAWSLDHALEVNERATGRRLVGWNGTVTLHLLTVHGANVLYVAPLVRVEDEIAAAAIESGEIKLRSRV